MGIDNLILHDVTRTHVHGFLTQPVHAVLITGADGIGKTAVAQAIIQTLLGLESGALHAYPHFSIIAPVNNTISIDAIRGLQKFLQLKTIGTQPLRRAALIEHAQNLTTEAQNAYLKLLEEPPADTLMILTADTPRAVLPTIRSRVQIITVHPPSQQQLQPLLQTSGTDAARQRQAYLLSAGLPGLLTALLAGDQEHPLLSSVAEAKALLQKTPFERLCLADTLSKQKDQARLLVTALERIAETMLAQAAATADASRIKQWHRIRKAAISAGQSLDRSANPKLTLTDLFLHL